MCPRECVEILSLDPAVAHTLDPSDAYTSQADVRWIVHGESELMQHTMSNDSLRDGINDDCL